MGQATKITKTTKRFKVAGVSINTNSFGLYQMIVVAKDGQAYQTCANYLNVKKEGDIINQEIALNEEGKIVSARFNGHELTEQIKKAPEDVIKELWGDE